MIIKNYTDTGFLLSHFYSVNIPTDGNELMGDLVEGAFSREGEFIFYLFDFYSINKNILLDNIITKNITHDEITNIWSTRYFDITANNPTK